MKVETYEGHDIFLEDGQFVVTTEQGEITKPSLAALKKALKGPKVALRVAVLDWTTWRDKVVIGTARKPATRYNDETKELLFEGGTRYNGTVFLPDLAIIARHREGQERLAAIKREHHEEEERLERELRAIVGELTQVTVQNYRELAEQQAARDKERESAQHTGEGADGHAAS
jgi:hypothetical protein